MSKAASEGPAGDLPAPAREPANTAGPLAGLRVIDAATLAAGPLIATWMGEHGAEVIKVEQPDGGDPLRQWGAQRDGVGLLWKSVARNKKCVTLNLRLEAGRDLLRSLTRQADVVIVNLRPSTLRRWSLDYGRLAGGNPGLVMVHVTGYGAGGPKSDWPGFGTLGEAMSGFAHLTGSPDGPPTLPSFMLADGVAALSATYAVMMALYHRDARGGTGQLIDISLIEPLARLLEQSVLTYDQLGTIPARTGNRWDISAPRNTYRTSDGRWLAMSGSAPAIALRALRAVGGPELATDPRFAGAQQLIFGAGDFSASQGARVDANFDPVVDIPGDIWHYARARVLVAARTAGIDAIDTPFPGYQDPEAYRVACERAAAMGFAGKWAIHPGQVGIANAAFSPTAGEIARAERLVAAYRAAQAAGKGAAGLDGMLVDAAHLRHAAAVAERAELLGLSGKAAPA